MRDDSLSGSFLLYLTTLDTSAWKGKIMPTTSIKHKYTMSWGVPFPSELMHNNYTCRTVSFAQRRLLGELKLGGRGGPIGNMSAGVVCWATRGSVMTVGCLVPR